ncbi:UDP-4-amino-4,6-dideoxy-N-acetyl-beta-L-altrosamine N-acetyltransferase [Marinospirillum sp.]|uniref:UDP-4-amino-4, 6-dideoxy-N-acetyl-beta-L-altrosamine N-acetyltransferase n=1 Tax=Marinospirillum sp. TaxID=2183934 RepID=UPI0038506D17
MTENLSIRTVVHDDLPLLLAWRNHPDVRRFMYSQHEISQEEHEAWFEKVSQDPNRHLLLYLEHQTPLGFCQFTTYQSRAEWGFYLSPDAPPGTGKSLGKAALDFAFLQHQWHKVSGEALSYNQPSIRFHTKLGFTEEGCLREHAKIGESFYDVFCFGLLRSEWDSKREKL